LRTLRDYKKSYATPCVPPRPKKDSPAAVSYPIGRRSDVAAKWRWIWLSSLVVAPKVRQFLFLKWHGKLYLGATNVREATCRFLREDGTPCSQKDSIKHFSRECPTARAAIVYVVRCWCDFWGQPEDRINHLGQDYTGDYAASLALGLVSWCLWRARSISSCAGETGRLVGARSIIADWRYQLSTTLEDMCRVRARNLKDYAVGGRWLKAINAEKNIYELVISFPPLSPTQSQSAFDSDATVY